jgi:hypothetical protein
MQKKIIVAAMALIAVFLVGFVPQYVKAIRLVNCANPAKTPQEPLRPGRRNRSHPTGALGKKIIQLNAQVFPNLAGSSISD